MSTDPNLWYDSGVVSQVLFIFLTQMEYKQVLRLQHLYFGEVTHEVKVNRIGNVYHCQVYTNGILNQEAIAENQSQIGYVCKSLLRWEDKCGNHSAFASSARNRLNTP